MKYFEVRKPFLTLLAALSLAACAEPEWQREIPKYTTQFEGDWLSHGYGQALRVKDGTFELYETTPSGCVEAGRGVIDYENSTLNVRRDFVEDSVQWYYRLDTSQGQLEMRDAGTGYKQFSRAELPASCADGATPASSDPALNFDIFWQTFDQQYPFFSLHGTDWPAISATWRPAALASQDLLQALSSVVSALADYHVYVADGQREPSWSRPYPPADIKKGISSVENYVSAHYAQQPRAAFAGNGSIAYQRLDGGVGYVLLLGMLGFGDDFAVDRVASEVSSAGAAMDEVLAAFGDVRALIIDVRLNSGGLDGVALALADRFADSKRLAFTKRPRDDSARAMARDYYVEPSGVGRFTRPVVVLTSRLTVSAAETFVLAMRVLPHVTTIGEPTAGALSDILDRHLPNGFRFGLSNEIYIAADGKGYEGIGIPPQIASDLDIPAFADNHDRNLEAALARLSL